VRNGSHLLRRATDAIRIDNGREHDFAALPQFGEATQHELSSAFRLAMRELAAGVCIVTTGQGSERAGLTATSVSSLSVMPPALLVSIQCKSRALKAVLARGVFGVNLLRANQRELADRFCGRGGVQGVARFEKGDWEAGDSGVPVLRSALAAVECRVEHVMHWHTHRVIVGSVSNVVLRGEGNALGYWRGRYVTPVSF
jgi:flavin reductase (DIM6/NTAB) family NADH-FMN oxidoreductase RutF